ncbi:hypothetical protein ABW20_dc0100759 [Dactylellina cionopaga]|nr:hypothetical protein ABW20_dc0100759 [Dactylellina cionopaga]
MINKIRNLFAKFTAGFLFFLEGAIIWGFKKPLYCFLFNSVESSSYSSITQRTFSLNIRTLDQVGGKEIEFSMIDHIEYPAIDEYLRKNQLKDASMTEARRAKLPSALIKENTGTKSELQAAEDELAGIEPEDSDDEDDDYKEDTDEGEDENEDGSDDSEFGDSETSSTTNGRLLSKTLAEEELGSELEEVEITDDELDDD